MSTDERVATGNGLDAQAATVTAAIAARGWELVATFTDEARSGGNLRRPALLDALPCRARGLAPRAEVAEAIAAERAARSTIGAGRQCRLEEVRQLPTAGTPTTTIPPTRLWDDTKALRSENARLPPRPEIHPTVR